MMQGTRSLPAIASSGEAGIYSGLTWHYYHKQMKIERPNPFPKFSLQIGLLTKRSEFRGIKPEEIK